MSALNFTAIRPDILYMEKDMEGVFSARGIMPVGSRSVLMRWKSWVAILLVGAGVGNAIALPALALCDPGNGRTTMSCCCSHDCPSSAKGGPGMQSSCCDMRRAPAQDAVPSVLPREAAPVSPVCLPAAAMLPLPVAPAFTDAVSGVPESLHAPPLYDLFCSYRI